MSTKAELAEVVGVDPDDYTKDELEALVAASQDSEVEESAPITYERNCS